MSTALYKRTEVIGRGKFGVVYKGYHKQTKQIVAIKVLNLDTEEDEVLDVQQEIQFLADLKNVPNVTHYYGLFLQETKLWIIMDYCAGGSVRTLLKAGVFEEKYIGVIVREVVAGLVAVHRLGVIHRDIKAANVLITNEGNVQLCDFGVAAQVTSNSLKRTTMAGTPYWMAPEVIRVGDQYNVKADIWSLGITIYEIATGNPPYCDKDANWAMQMISKLTPPRLEGREYLPMLKECIALCLDESPEERALAEDLSKCKLVKFYKNYSTSILKEVITRYLLWRDRNLLRDLVFMNLDDELARANGHADADGQLQVKWDFDSLSSKEYILDNDISMDQVENDTYDADASNTDTLGDQPTLNLAQRYADLSTITMNGRQLRNTISGTSGGLETATGIPRSLVSLFEDVSPDIPAVTSAVPLDFELPASGFSSTSDVRRLEIEIPDMDNLGQYAGKQQPSLSKPPALYHSQSASGNLETRFASNRARKKTVLGPSAPHTPPYATHLLLKTPSPVQPPPTLAAVAESINNGSPLKSMRALLLSNNPLLQPINFKLPESAPPAVPSAGPSGPVPPPPAPLVAPPVPPKQREKPSLHIQMPTPSTTFNALLALTNETFDVDTSHDNDNVNQFGINPSHMTQYPMTMTPVTERENPTEAVSAPATEGSETAQSRPDRHQKKFSSLLGPSTAPVSTSNGLLLPRNASFAAISPNAVAAAPVAPKSKFPVIPSINGEFFLDSVSKGKLLSELDVMIRLFNQGLDALESNIG